MSLWKCIRVLEILLILVILSVTPAMALQDPLESENKSASNYTYVNPVSSPNASPSSHIMMDSSYFNRSDLLNEFSAEIKYNPVKSDEPYATAASQNITIDENILQQDFQDFNSWIKYGPSFGYTEIQMQKCLGGSAHDRGTSIIQTNDGGSIVLGTTGSNDGDVAGGGFHGGYDFWIVKLNENGAIQWQKCLGGSGSDTAYSIQQTSDGGYIVAGDTNSNDGDMAGSGFHGGYDFWIAKLNEFGVIQWQKCLGGSNDDTARSIKQMHDGGYVVAGWTYSNDNDVAGGGFHGRADSWAVKLSDSGEILWQKCLGGSDDDAAESISVTDDGGIIIAGVTYSSDGDVTGKHNPNSRNPDFWVVKLNSAGTIQWQKCLGGSNADWSYSIQQTDDDGHIVAGKTCSNDGDVSGNHGNCDSWTVKLNSVGTIQWQRCLGGSHSDEAYGVQQTDDGGYIIIGDTYSDDGDVSGSHVAPYYIYPDFWVVRLNNAGYVVWQKALGGSNADIAHGIEQTDDGGYMIIGVTNSNDGDVSGNHGLGDFWVVRLSPEPVLVPDFLGNYKGNGVWALDYNGNGAWDGVDIDRVYVFGSPTDQPVVGDWDGDGKDELGNYKGNGVWALDYNGNGAWDGVDIDRVFVFGSPTDRPVVGDWNGDGKDELGNYKGNGVWALDYNGNGAWDGVDIDRVYVFGSPTDQPVVGDWNGDGKDELGNYKGNGVWALDFNGNGAWDGVGIDRVYVFGSPTDQPVVGDWDGDGKDDLGNYKGNGVWALDFNGNGAWDGVVIDRVYVFGISTDKPVVGRWK